MPVRGNPTITKICIVGDQETGKTSIQRLFTKKRFKRNYHPTIGSDFSSFEIKSKTGQSYRLALWDLSGDPKYKTSHSTYYQGIGGLIVVFDLTKKETLTNALNWLNSVEKYVVLDFPIILVGNKKDLPVMNSMGVSDNDVRNLILKFKEIHQSDLFITYLKSSAKTNENIDEIFYHLVETIEKISIDNKLKLEDNIE